jgi:hypothetical protein
MPETDMAAALAAIQQEAARLLRGPLPPDVQKGLELIESIARYKADVRGQGEATGKFKPRGE